MNLPILITAALVSVDAFFVGISLGAQKRPKLRHLLSIVAIVFAACSVAFWITSALRSFISFDISRVAGFIFLLLGLRALTAKNPASEERGGRLLTAKNDAAQSGTAWRGIIGFGLLVSIDGVVATAALTVGQADAAIVPFIIAATHLLFITAGSSLAQRVRLAGKMQNLISASSLFLIAFFRLFELGSG
ncbi:MAG: manganese efflux pump [Firmicutes bacterium]|nr:manganese efflux pump [Bacillota bacterium]